MYMKVFPPIIKNSSDGSITVFALAAILLLTFTFMLSAWAGRLVEKKIEASVQTDELAMSIGNHVADGLNIISVNNFAIASLFHVHSALHFLGRYTALY